MKPPLLLLLLYVITQNITTNVNDAHAVRSAMLCLCVCVCVCPLLCDPSAACILIAVFVLICDRQRRFLVESCWSWGECVRSCVAQNGEQGNKAKLCRASRLFRMLRLTLYLAGYGKDTQHTPTSVRKDYICMYVCM